MTMIESLSKRPSSSIAPTATRFFPSPCEPFRDKNPAEGLTVAIDGAKLAAILIFVAPSGRQGEAAGIEQTVQPTLGRFTQLRLTHAARWTEFGRVDIGDADLLTTKPEIVAIDHAVCASRAGADGERGRKGVRRRRAWKNAATRWKPPLSRR